MAKGKQHPAQARFDRLLADQYEPQKLADLFQVVRKRLRELKRRYREAVYAPNPEEALGVLHDHYYMLEREGKLLLKENRTLIVSCGRRSGLPLLGEVLLLSAEDETFTTDQICAAIGQAKRNATITGMEMDCMVWSLRFCILAHFCRILGSKTGTAAELFSLIRILAASDTIDLSEITRRENPLELFYHEDEDYPRLDETSRWLYRTKTSRIALKEGKSELEAAVELRAEAKNGASPRERHIGYPIYKRYSRLYRTVSERTYRTTQLFLPLLAAVLAGILLRSWWPPFLLYLPLWAMLKPILDHIFMRSLRHEYLPRIELNGEIPDDAKTLVVISTLLPGQKELLGLHTKLERLYYANPAKNLRFLVLCDLKQANVPVLPEDKSLLQSAVKLIRKLNTAHDDRFLLLVRPRSYSKTQGEYTGFERKRGAIEQLVCMMRGGEMSLLTSEGDLSFLREARYICALDADTRALMDTVTELVAVALHPLHRPEAEGGIVRRGYGIIAPKMVTNLVSSMKTPFAKIMGGVGGSCAYDDFCADLYQDGFGEGIFAGKGLINVDIFHELLADTFPEERVLSHDILESGFLRTAFVGDIAFSDDFPSDSVAYYKRAHRWIRGDIQNIPYLLPTIDTRKGRIRNPLTPLSRFKLLDNVRRAITPAFILACLYAAAFAPTAISVTLTVVALLATVMTYWFGFFPAVLAGGIFSLSRRFYAGVLPQAALLLAQSAYALILLPKQALSSLDATLRALWRRFVSHKRLLEWTTAAQVDRAHAGTRGKKLSAFLYAEIASLLLILPPTPHTRLLGILFAFVLPLVFYADQPYPERGKPRIAQPQKDKLLSRAAAMWRFYEDYADATENYLPPDNVQNAPVYAIAHRTSPTNIGLMLVSALAARDLDLMDSETLARKLSQTLDTLERLPKWKGNLYNWYDTQTLALLRPAYVSSVDSGNFLCCLVTLKEGLREYTGAYAPLRELIPRLEALIDGADLSAFYDRSKKLLSIGFDEREDALSRNHYDLLMSEARMTSYFAIAKRQIPKKHWLALGRTMARLDSYAGPISWTGTMFEFFMPELFLRCAEGSMGYEGLRFCLHCQKRRAKELHIPYGISESGYYAFDSQLNYQYKAHGVQKLGLKRGLDREVVVSPYSTYLTLSRDFTAAYANLDRLARMGAVGTYGHYEAIDFTRSRIGDGRGYAMVKSYMAHHIGMSLVAIDNCLNDGVMQRRFMADPFMESASELLEERVAAGAVVFEDIPKKEPVRKTLRETPQTECYANFYPQQPQVALLCNGEITSVLTDLGISHCLYQGKLATVRTRDLLRRPQGPFIGVVEGGKSISFTYLPHYDGDSERTVEFSANAVDYYCNARGLRLGMQVYLHENLPCELRRIAVKNTTGRKRSMTLAAYLEPALAPADDLEAHPAFMRFFLREEYDAKNRLFIVSRKDRHSDDSIWMAVGFLDELDFHYSLNREQVLTRPYGAGSVFDHADERVNHIEQTPEPCIFIKAPVTLDAHSQEEHILFTCMALSREELLTHVAKLRAAKTPQPSALQSPIVQDTIEGRLALGILPMLLFNKRDSVHNLKAVEENRLPVRELWSLGISGDLPIVLAEVPSATDEERINAYLRCHRALKLSGIAFDLVFSYSDGGAYERPVHDFLRALLAKERAEGILGCKGGIHLINLDETTYEIANLLAAAASHIAPRGMMRVNLPSSPFVPLPIQPIGRMDTHPHGASVAGGTFTNESFTITAPPPRPWCTVLANPSFGTLVSESALGFTWAANSQGNKLTPWFNDASTDNRGEMLLIRSGERCIDPVWGSEAAFTPDQAVYSGRSDLFTSRVAVAVSAEGCAKHITLNLENNGNTPLELAVAYYTEPVLGSSREWARFISGSFEDGALFLRNPAGGAVPGVMALSADQEIVSYTLDRAAFLSGRWDECLLTPSGAPCAAICIKLMLPPRGSVSAEFTLSFAQSQEAAWKELRRPAGTPSKGDNHIEIDTPDPLLNVMFNTWLPWQTLGGRMYARTGFYQNGGAWGFRDQLQDACASVLTHPKSARRQILRACTAQFPEGDVLHWWHVFPGRIKKGVRTRYSDDLLFLPYTTCEYADKTGDSAIFDASTAYADAPLLVDDEHERYVECGATSLRETVYEHCRRAIMRTSSLLGKHGLPLIGGGDWSDGYNAVGKDGKGESVWLALFFAIVLRRFALVAKERGDTGTADGCKVMETRMMNAVEEHGWDGEWYLRAFYDNGAAMGSHANAQCKIDSLPQSFATLAGLSNIQRRKLALDAAYRLLVDPAHGIVRLFTPAFGKEDAPLTAKTGAPQPHPGYVAAYPKGIRENGGQYTHAAVWLCMAFFEAGDTEKGYKLLNMLNPAKLSTDPQRAAKYRGEPYYLAGDIYTNHECYGRSGWTIYTGASGWYYRVVLEQLLGIRICGDELCVVPRIPESWEGFRARLSYRNTHVEIRVQRAAEHKGSLVDGTEGHCVCLDGNPHTLEITL